MIAAGAGLSVGGDPVEATLSGGRNFFHTSTGVRVVYPETERAPGAAQGDRATP